MNKKLAVTFFAALAIFYALLHAGSLLYFRHQEKQLLSKIGSVQEDIQERFRLFLDTPLSIGLAGSDYFATGDLTRKDYGRHALEILKINKEILGLNLVDAQGKIVRVYPLDLNPHAVGKISQNYPYFSEHFKKNTSYWFSPPFKLYQGELGFVFYVPILQNGTLKGWFAPVISSSQFFEKFKLSELLQDFDLVIRDAETNQDYFATAMLPEKDVTVFETNLPMMGRSLIFKLWRKIIPTQVTLPWHLLLSGAFLLSLLAVYVQRLYELRKRARTQLDDISILLRLTAKDALGKLIDDDISVHEKNSYISNLLEQIDLLQTMAQSGEGPDQEEQLLSPLLHEQLLNLSELIHKKELKVIFDDRPLGLASVYANRWLLQNCILCNVLVHSIIFSRPQSTIEIHYQTDDEKHLLSFHTSRVLTSDQMDAFAFDRRLEVAKKVLKMYQGEILLQRDLTEGMIIKITLPIYA